MVVYLFGYTISSSTNTFWTESGAKSAINSYGPILMSCANKPYYDHTIMLFGYVTYKSSANDKYVFFATKDGYTNSTRYYAGRSARTAATVSYMTKIVA